MSIHCPGTWDSRHHGSSRGIRILSSVVFKGSCYATTSAPCRLRQEDCELEAKSRILVVTAITVFYQDSNKDFHDLLKSNLSDTWRRTANGMSPIASPPQSAEWLAGLACRELHQLWVYGVPTKGVIVCVNLSLNYTVKIWVTEHSTFNGVVIIHQVDNLQF